MNTTKRKHSLLLLFVITAAIAATACDKPDELPEKGYGYPLFFILPSPTEMTSADRNYLQQLRDEYDANKDK